MKKMSDCYLFQLLNKRNNLDSLKNIRENDIIRENNLEEQLLIIRKRFNYGLKERVLTDFQRDKTLLVYNPELLMNIPKTIPSWLYLYNGELSSVINLTRFATGKKENLSIDPRTLFALLHYGVILKECKTNWNKLTLNSELIKNTTIVYAKMFTKILDKLFGISSDKIVIDKVLYTSAKFFLINQLGKDNTEVTNDYAFRATSGQSTRAIIEQVDENFEDNAYENIETFIKDLSLEIPALSKLNLRLFLQEYLLFYGEASLLGLEFFPLFLSNVIASTITSQIVKGFAYEAAAGSYLLDTYATVSNLIK